MKAAAVIVALAVALSWGYAFAQEAPGEEQPVKPREKTGLDAKIEKLVKQLGSDEYKEREAATEELKKIGEPALPALKEALKSSDLEVRLRAETVIKALAKKRTAGKDGRPGTADPTDAPSTSPRLGKELEEVLKDLPEEMRKQVEKMLEQMEELERGLKLPPRMPPVPGEKDDGEDDDDAAPDEMRKMFEEMRKSAEEARKRMDELRRRGLERPRRPQPDAPKTQPREDEKAEKDEKAPEGEKKVRPKGKSGTTIVIKRLTWKDGKLVEDKEYEHDSSLPGLSVTDRGDVLEALRYHLGLGEKEGVLVDEVKKDSPFAKGGVAKHDIITKVDGETVESKKTLARLLSGKEKASLEVMRQGKRTTIELNLGKGKEDTEKEK